MALRIHCHIVRRRKTKITVFYIHKTLTHILDLFVIEIFNLVIRTVNILY